MKKNFQNGFTLIELLVVIAIIGILASVVLASLNSARNKGADAATKAQLANARAQAEIFYDSGSTYASVCSGANGIGPMNTAANSSSGSSTCASNANAWVMFATLKAGNANNNAWCVDSTGASKMGNIGNINNSGICL